MARLPQHVRDKIAQIALPGAHAAQPCRGPGSGAAAIWFTGVPGYGSGVQAVTAEYYYAAPQLQGALFRAHQAGRPPSRPPGEWLSPPTHRSQNSHPHDCRHLQSSPPGFHPTHAPTLPTPHIHPPPTCLANRPSRSTAVYPTTSPMLAPMTSSYFCGVQEEPRSCILVICLLGGWMSSKHLSGGRKGGPGKGKRQPS